MADKQDKAEAIMFCKKAHQGQKRKYTGEPYWEHPMEVANIVKEHAGTDDEIIAALLHDTVEDTDVTFEQILNKFGYQVFYLVFWLTDISKPEDGNRALRKTIDRMHLTGSHDPAVYRIKCADIISNAATIKQHDPHFAELYLAEKDALLRQMATMLPCIKGEPLYQKAAEII